MRGENDGNGKLKTPPIFFNYFFAAPRCRKTTIILKVLKIDQNNVDIRILR